MMVLVGLGIMHIGGIDGLDEKTRLPFGLALLTGAAAANTRATYIGNQKGSGSRSSNTVDYG